MVLKKLPIWIQNLKEIIEENYLYVDKTKEAFNLITGFKYSFLARPRRFGKSLFLDTLKEIFEWNKNLFKWLYIYDKWDWSKKYPVIKISWSWDLRSPQQVKENVIALLKFNQKRLDVFCESSNNYSICFKELIENTAEKYNQKVVILIDEYDKPILDNLDQIEVAKENREILRSFYWVIKDLDEYIKFVFVTWVSKFSKASIFSGLNNLEDISLTPEFGNICWITQQELETTLKEYLKWADLEKVKQWYNWYNFLKDDVYNPFDILLFIRNNYKFSNYWFATWTPTFLIKLIEKNNFYLPQLSNLQMWETLLDSFDVENIKPEIILYQAGYLTIDRMYTNEEEEIMYKLKIPNKEVRMSLNKHLIDYLTGDINQESRSKIHIYLKQADLGKLKSEIERLFASIPYNNYTKNIIAKYEWYYSAVLYAYLESLWYDIIWEDTSNTGRTDLTMIMQNKIYIFEFKVDSKEEPIKQIKERQYYKKYENSWKEIYLVWIKFSSKKRNIEGFKWEEF